MHTLLKGITDAAVGAYFNYGISGGGGTCNGIGIAQYQLNIKATSVWYNGVPGALGALPVVGGISRLIVDLYEVHQGIRNP